jgi:hypothetical protein
VKTEITVIEPVPITDRPAIQVARECYNKWRGITNFEQDVAHYLEYGMIVSRPDVFAMGKIIYYKGEPAWFIRVAVGNLKALLRLLPVPLSHICFCRRGVKLRAYPLERMLKLAND